ncbi:MAG: diacylglycerol kinase family lipid kinase [Chloroflexi bacterium]|nr:diacylglycerol kinase family lipid kinase [Chloroflexota bacterium]
MGKPKAFVIVNPVAANGRVAVRWPDVRAHLTRLGLDFDFRLTERPLHATEIAREAAQAGYSPIVAYGGDGTLMEVVNGLLGEPGQPSEVPLGIIPGGTGSDFVRTLGIPHDYREACARLMSGTERLVDVGHTTFRAFDGSERRMYFANVAGLGFDGEVVERVQRSSKALGGTLTYLMNLLLTLVYYKNKHVALRFDGQSQDRRMNSVLVCNGRYFGGAMYIAPPAELQDGEFELVILGDFSKPELVVNVPRVYKGTHLTHPKVQIHKACEVHVEAKERMLVQADGELVGQAPASFRIVPRVLRVIA